MSEPTSVDVDETLHKESYLSLNNLLDFKRLKSSFRCQRVNLNHAWYEMSLNEYKQWDFIAVKMCAVEISRAGILYQIISDTSNTGIHIAWWLMYHHHHHRLFDVGFKKERSKAAFLTASLVFVNPKPLFPLSLYLPQNSQNIRLDEISNVTEYVICIFTLAASVHTKAKEWESKRCLFSTRTLLFLSCIPTRVKINKWRKIGRKAFNAEKSAHIYIQIFIY